jgi:hypothetical protein
MVVERYCTTLAQKATYWDRTARERMALLRAEVSASARSRAEKGGAGGVLQILRRVESGVNT